jgi:hypothetical protein
MIQIRENLDTIWVFGPSAGCEQRGKYGKALNQRGDYPPSILDKWRSPKQIGPPYGDTGIATTQTPRRTIADKPFVRMTIP